MKLSTANFSKAVVTGLLLLRNGIDIRKSDGTKHFIKCNNDTDTIPKLLRSVTVEANLPDDPTLSGVKVVNRNTVFQVRAIANYSDNTSETVETEWESSSDSTLPIRVEETGEYNGSWRAGNVSEIVVIEARPRINGTEMSGVLRVRVN